jgi:hypothetical protein
MDKEHKLIPLPQRSFQVYGRSHRLKTMLDCTKLLGKLVNNCLMGKMDEARATKLAYIITALMNGIEKSELEDRLSKIEKRLVIVDEGDE